MTKRIFFFLLFLTLAGCTAKPAPQETQLPPPATISSPATTQSAVAAPTRTPAPTATRAPTPTPTPVYFTGAGDIAICGQTGDDETAALLAGIPGDFFTAGDNSNEDGSLYQLENCFGKSWGAFKARIHPAAGNHEYYTPGAEPYYQYFGAAAGSPGEGWYSFEYGGWHMVILNSNCNDVACGKSSPQLDWLRADLAAHPAQCTLAIWHHPRWSSGLAGSDGRMSPAYRALYEAGAEIVISGHEHEYERFTPLDPDGKPDPQRGLRQFVVGTGGVNYLPFAAILPESEAHQSGAFGVLRFTLYPDRYEWKFIPVAGQTYTDQGSGTCH